MQFISVFGVCWMYLRHDVQPLMLDTPASAGTGIPHGAFATVTFSTLWTTITAGCSQVLMVAEYHNACTEFSRSSTRMVCCLIALAALPFGCILGSQVAISYNWWPEHTAVQEINLMMLGDSFFIAFDLLLTAAFWRLRRDVAPDKEPRLSRLLHIAFITYNASQLFLNLRFACTLLGVSYNGWLGCTIGLGGFLTSGNLHVISLFIMFHVLEDSQVTAGATDRAHENNSIAAMKDAVMLVDV
ncbi:uncharacterized protein PHACADRAFT_257111 [Phanerochaete carnosa HHB-10118-sp]|uniref:Uncharacterized protein n=1 Tax=Phanerochaete carnosa (strain HHB-10118-sp) TaxID=650164 RepID=K5WZW0_PHACS|nr:uncharacterized protein PHACADRAFT_257111 [Phanerochaete carnosa HHB-10118-sp]EKM56062.1 hypothetical protein PHACADRAFT_257111 [Phanerochaete carnosa HHB-10118-sp]